MMKRSLLFLAVLVIGGAAWQLVDPKPTHAASCCTFGSDCGTNWSCCLPTAGEADCSSTQKNYCIDGRCRK
jgi:hypothetical protein